MSCNVLAVEIADLNIIEEFGVFVGVKVLGYSLSPPKLYKSTKEAVWCTRNFHRVVLNSGRLDYSELPSLLRRNLKGE